MTSTRAEPWQLGREIVEIISGQAMKAMPSACAATSAQRQLAFAFLRAHLAEAEQARQPAIALAVDRIGEQARRVGQIEPAADQRLSAPRLCRRCASAPLRPACCGRRSRSHPCRARAPQHQLDRVRRPAQEGERRGDAELDISGARRRHVLARQRPMSHASSRTRASCTRSTAEPSFGDDGHQPNSPWMNQPGAPPRPSPIRPSR